MYFIKVVLKKEHTRELREVLIKIGFGIYLVNTTINKYTMVDNPKIEPFEKPGSDEFIRYICIYNGPVFPPHLIDLLEDSRVIEYTIEKK